MFVVDRMRKRPSRGNRFEAAHPPARAPRRAEPGHVTEQVTCKHFAAIDHCATDPGSEPKVDEGAEPLGGPEHPFSKGCGFSIVHHYFCGPG